MGYNNTNNNTNTNVQRVILTPNNNNNIDIVRAKEIEVIAHKLADKFGSPESIPFYCKVAWALPESYIWKNFEASQKARNPGALFNFLCRKDISRVRP